MTFTFHLFTTNKRHAWHHASPTSRWQTHFHKFQSVECLSQTRVFDIERIQLPFFLFSFSPMPGGSGTGFWCAVDSQLCYTVTCFSQAYLYFMGTTTHRKDPASTICDDKKGDLKFYSTGPCWMVVRVCQMTQINFVINLCVCSGTQMESCYWHTRMETHVTPTSGETPSSISYVTRMQVRWIPISGLSAGEMYLPCQQVTWIAVSILSADEVDSCISPLSRW